MAVFGHRESMLTTERSDTADAPQALGFTDGVVVFARGASLFTAQPSLLRLAVTPAICTIIILGYLLDAGFALVQAEAAPRAGSAWAAATGWLLEHGSASYVVPAIGASLVIVSVVHALSASALDAIARAQLKLEQRHFESWDEAFFRVAESNFVALFVALIPLGALTMLGVGYPTFWPLTTGVALAVCALTLAWNLLGYGMWDRELEGRARFTWLLDHQGAALGLGMACTVALLVPPFSIVLLPWGVSSAMLLLVQCERREPR